jgi:hypothetical protein
MEQTPRYFFAGTEISEVEAEDLEAAGHIHVATAGSGGMVGHNDPQYRQYGDETPWVLMKAGPGNVWIEQQPGNCYVCFRPWAEHLRPVWVRKDKEHTCILAPVSHDMSKDCRICGRVPDPAIVNDNHKMSCNYGERWQNKVTAPVEMLREFAPKED